MSVVCITKIIHTKCHYGYIICVIQQCLSLVQYTEQLNVAYRLSGLMEKINTIADYWYNLDYFATKRDVCP